MRTPLPVADEDGSAPITGGAGDGAEINDRRSAPPASCSASLGKSASRTCRACAQAARQARRRGAAAARGRAQGRRRERQGLDHRRARGHDARRVAALHRGAPRLAQPGHRAQPQRPLPRGDDLRARHAARHRQDHRAAPPAPREPLRQGPFDGRRGVARIVPEVDDLETEGAPYWWAAGFQSGDRTTVRFSWGTIPGLGRTLTHELTHYASTA